MDINKFTQKSIQAVQDCQKLAYKYGNQKIEQAHLLLALLTQEDSLVFRLLGKMNILEILRSRGTVFSRLSRRCAGTRG